MGPPNALESTGTMLVSGDRKTVAEFTPVLAKMTGKVLDFGPETGRAAAMKLLGNCFLVAFTTGIADTLMLAKGMHVPLSELNTLFDTWNPAAMLPGRLKRMTSGNFGSPSWELNMARKDTGLFLQEAKKGGVSLAVIPAIANEMDRWIAKGHGSDDWTVISKAAVS
jgi:3-hydroxyisobutyrate dehydrogenase